MRVVLDTNVLISGIFFSGIPRRILKAWRDGILSIVITKEIFTEYQRVLLELHDKYSKIEIQPVIELIQNNAEYVVSKALDPLICRDPDDDKFVSAAISGNTAIIISGDNDLLTLSGYENLIIMTPKAFAGNFLS